MLTTTNRMDPSLKVMGAFFLGSVAGASLSCVLFDSSQRTEAVAFTALCGLVSAVCISLRSRCDWRKKTWQVLASTLFACTATGAVIGVLNKLAEPEQP